MLWPIALAVSTLVLILALTGRRVPAPPHCRRCHFDLTGLATTATCPECGRALTDPREIRHSRRARSRALVALAVLGMLGSVGGLALNATRVGFALAPLMPTAVLLRVARHTEGPAAASSIGELATRRVAGSLSAQQTATFHADLLSRLVSPTASWPRAARTELWNAFDTKTLSPADHDRYWQAAARTATLRPRRVVRAGQPVPAHISFAASRFGPDPTSFAANTALPIQWWLHESVSSGAGDPPPESAHWRQGGSGSSALSTQNVDWAMQTSLPSYTGTGPAVARIRLWFAPDTVQWGREPPPDAFWVTAEAPFKSVPADTPVIIAHPDPKLADWLGRNLRFGDVSVFLDPGIDGFVPRLETFISLPGTNLGVAFAPTIRIAAPDGRELSLDLPSLVIAGNLDRSVSVASHAQTIRSQLGHPSTPESKERVARLKGLLGLPDNGPMPNDWVPPPLSVTLTLRTSVLAAEADPQVRDIWSGEIRFDAMSLVKAQGNPSYALRPKEGAHPSAVTAGPPLPDAPCILTVP